MNDKLHAPNMIGNEPFFILIAASAKHNAGKLASGPPPVPSKKSPKKQGTTDVVKMNTPILAPSTLAPPIESPVAVNHLFIGHRSNKRNRHVADAPRIAPMFSKSGFVGVQHPSGPNSLTTTKTSAGSRTPSPKHMSPEKISEKNEATKNNTEDCESVVNVSTNPKKIERSMSDTQSSDGYMSEASNNTRGSASQTIDLESDTDTIGEHDNVIVSDVANMKDVEDEKKLIDLRDKEIEECDELINEISAIVETDGKDNRNDATGNEKELLPDSNSNYDLHSKEVFQKNTDSSLIENVHLPKAYNGDDSTCNVQANSCPEKVVESSPKLDNEESPNSNNNVAKLKTPQKMDHSDSETSPTHTDTSTTAAYPRSLNSSSSEASPKVNMEQQDGDIAKIHHEGTNKLQVDDTDVPNEDVSPTHSFHSDMESYLNSKQIITSGKTSPSAIKSFSPFQNRPMINERRAQNGLRLGLYSAEDISQQNCKKIAGNCDRIVSSIGRAQINACLHRQYMVEVKQQAKHRKN